MDVTVPFFMYAEQAVDALARLDQQRRWIARPAGAVKTFTVDKSRAEGILPRPKPTGAVNSPRAKVLMCSTPTVSASAAHSLHAPKKRPARPLKLWAFPLS